MELLHERFKRLTQTSTISVTSPIWFFLNQKENQMTMTIPNTSIVPAALATDRSQRNVQFKPLKTLPILTDTDYIQVDVPFRCKNAQEIRTLAKQVGVRFHSATATWRISPVAIQQLGVIDTLNALCLVCSFVQKKQTTEFLNRGMHWTKIICKVPFEDRGIASAAGAKWNSVNRFWWIAVKHNDAAFSDLIRDWEIAGWIDLDATERDRHLGTPTPTYSIAQMKATRMIGSTPIGGQFTAIPQVQVTLAPVASMQTELSQMQTESERLFRDEVENGYLGLCDRLLRSTLERQDPYNADIVYYIDCFYMNPKFAHLVSPQFGASPIVFVRTRVRGTNPVRHEWNSYFMTADLMRKFWDQATSRGFIKYETKPMMAGQMKDLLDYANVHREVKTIESGCEHDQVFVVAEFEKVLNSRLVS